MKNAIFDFDGTLADSAMGIIVTEWELLKELGLPHRTEAQIRAAIGLPLGEALHVGGNIPENILDYASDRYRELFMEIAPRHIVLFPEVKETLSFLAGRGIPMAIATSRSRDSLELLLKSLGIDGFFELCITAKDVEHHKPEPEPVLKILEKLSWKAEETLVVGDTTFDILMGKRAGCPTVGVTYGNHSRETLLTAEPTHLADTFGEIPVFLR